jgi:hypothetical protein
MAGMAMVARRIAAAVMRRVGAVRANNDRGDVIGWAIMIPLSIALFLSAVQVAMWYQARNMCQAAAQAGARSGKAFNASGDAGSGAANNYLAQTADRSVSGARVTESLTATTVSVTCRGNALTLLPIPGLTTVSQSASAARERFTTPGTP